LRLLIVNVDFESDGDAAAMEVLDVDLPDRTAGIWIWLPDTLHGTLSCPKSLALVGALPKRSFAARTPCDQCEQSSHQAASRKSYGDYHQSLF